MPIDSGFSTRRELVKKYNPNHGPDGRFTSGGSGSAGARAIAQRGGGTAGPPTRDAFGNPMRGYRNTNPPKQTPAKQTPAAHNQQAQYAASHLHGKTDGGTDKSRDPNFNQGEGDPELAGSIPYQVQNPAGPGFQFSSAQRQANAREMFGQYAVARHGVPATSTTLIADPYGETARKPNILVRPDPYDTTKPSPKVSTKPSPKVPTSAQAAETALPETPRPKQATMLDDSRMKRLSGESTRDYIDRRNALLRLMSEREKKNVNPNQGKPPAFVHARSRAGR